MGGGGGGVGGRLLPGTVPLLVPSCLPTGPRPCPTELGRMGWGISSLMGQHPGPWLLDSCPCLPRRTVLTGISLRPSLLFSPHQTCISFPSLRTHLEKLSTLQLPDCLLKTSGPAALHGTFWQQRGDGKQKHRAQSWVLGAGPCRSDLGPSPSVCSHFGRSPDALRLFLRSGSRAAVGRG